MGIAVTSRPSRKTRPEVDGTRPTPQETDDFPGLQLQAHIHHRDLRAVVLGERFDADQTLFAGGSHAH